MMRSSFFLLLSLVALAAYAEPPGSIEVAYELKRNGSAIADVVERLQYSQGKYRLAESWKGRGIYALLGSAQRVSEGSIVDDVLRPSEFSDARSGRDTARAWFDWKAMVLTMQYKGDRKSERLFPDGQDRLSFLLALSLLPGHASSVTYHIADGKGISYHRYEVRGSERINTPAGDFNTVRVARVGHPGEKDSAELWLAADLGYIPVRLLDIEGDGTQYDQVATRISRP